MGFDDMLVKGGAAFLFVLIILIMVDVFSGTVDVNSFCQGNGFDQGTYYSDADGIYCHNNGVRISAIGRESNFKKDLTFFPDVVVE